MKILHNTLINHKMLLKKSMWLKNMRLEVVTKVLRVRASAMVGANSFIRMEVITKDNGRITKWMGMVNCITKEVR